MKRRRASNVATMSALLLLLSEAVWAAPTGGGNLEITQRLGAFFLDWVGPIATMFAIAGLVFAFIQIGLSRGPEAFSNAIRWAVVVVLVVGITAVLESLGISGATI